MPEWVIAVWKPVITVVHLAAALTVTTYVLLQDRQSKAAVAWIGLAWLAPVIGSIAFLCLGINRIERKADELGFAEVRKSVPIIEPRSEDIAKLNAMAEDYPNLIGLVGLGTLVTDRKLLAGNAVEPLIDGDEAFPAMIEAIDGAQVSVSFLSYIFDSDRIGQQFLEALVRACERGVEVRVLIDHVGSRYSKPNMVRRLKEVGVRVGAFLPPGKAGMFRFANLRNHRKILVADGKIGFTGGTNIREGHCLKLQPAYPVQCLHFRFEGPVVVHLQEAFAVDWAFTTGERLDSEIWFHAVEPCGDVAARGISDGPDDDLDKMKEIILGGLAAATTRVRIVTPYFLPSETMQWALAVAAMRDVQVDIVLPAQSNIRPMDWAMVPQMSFLLAKGCNIFRSPDPFDHTKLLIVDGAWSLVGSTNWDPRSLRLNFEYNIECYDEALAAQLEEIVERKIAAARQVTPEEIAQRNVFYRLRDGAAQLLSPYL